MCVFKYHAFIYFLRPPPWYGTGTTALVYCLISSSLYTGTVQGWWSTPPTGLTVSRGEVHPNWSDGQQRCSQLSTAAYFLFCRFFCTSSVPCCSSISSLFLLLVTNLLKIVALQQRLRKIWNQLPSASFGLIFMSKGLNKKHLWWHCPF